MKLDQIKSREQIALHRSKLQRELNVKERRLRHDADRVTDRWRRITNVGSTIISAALNVSTYVGMFSGAFSLVRRLFFRRRK